MLFEKQEYQEKCVSNIVDIINDGVDFGTSDYSNLKPTLKDHYDNNQYKQFSISDNNRLDVIMETGTGKTFTYIKTILELNKQYGLNRFIIVVPRNAIKAGVIQNIKLTKEYFFNDYSKHLNIIEYPKDGVSKVESDFLGDDNRLSVLVLTSNSFANKDAILNRPPEAGLLHKHGTVWDCVAYKRPVVIIDEPHLLKGGKTTESLGKLKDSLFIRFGATYPTDKGHELSNVAYSLDSISAFNEYLVKRIRVNTLLSDSESGEYQLTNIDASGGNTNKKFTITYFLNHENYSKTLKVGDDIGAKTGISSLNGVHAVKITAGQINLSNQTVWTLDVDKTLSEDETRLMIRSTIETHFEKEERLFNQDIKTLTLFFIKNVHDFRGESPMVKRLFEEEYITKRKSIIETTTNQEYRTYLERDYDKDGNLAVHEGYFSGDGHGKGTADDKLTADIDLILNKKEELLHTSNPLRFIFSVWALQEGWDNPNIFNICKLAPTDKETSRRQQVGRGLRMAVNEEGKRQTYKYLEENEHSFYNINTLDMIVSKYELNFIEGIQSEIQQASYSLVGDIISHSILEEKGLTSKEASRFLASLEDDEIITYNDTADDYTIESSIHSYLQEHGSSFKYFDAERLEEVKRIFQENVKAIENGNSKKNRKTVKIKSNLWPDFKELWETINRKSKIVYSQLEESDLIQRIATSFDKENIPAINVKIVTKEYDTHTNVIINKQETTMQDRVSFFTNKNYDTLIDTLVKDSKFKLPLPFTIKLINALDLDKFHKNPKEATKRLKSIIGDQIHKSVIKQIEYSFENKTRLTELQNKETGEYLQEFPHTVLGRDCASEEAPPHLLYDTIVYDSGIEKVIQIKDPIQLTEGTVTVFGKLPKIHIPTPYKTYNPDFAYLVSKPNGKKLFLVVEAKGYNSETEIPPAEQNKIAYAEKFFETLQKHLPDIEISFKKRVNKTELGTLLKEIEQEKAA